jgi:hypothetical protein
VAPLLSRKTLPSAPEHPGHIGVRLYHYSNYRKKASELLAALEQKPTKYTTPILNEESLLKRLDVATSLGISASTFTKWEKAGEFDGLFFTINGRKFTTAEQLRKWVRARHQHSFTYAV